MSLHVFAISALDSDADAERLNAGIRGQREVQIERHLVADGARSFWMRVTAARQRRPKGKATGALVGPRVTPAGRRRPQPAARVCA